MSTPLTPKEHALLRMALRNWVDGDRCTDRADAETLLAKLQDGLIADKVLVEWKVRGDVLIYRNDPPEGGPFSLQQAAIPDGATVYVESP